MSSCLNPSDRLTVSCRACAARAVDRRRHRCDHPRDPACVVEADVSLAVVRAFVARVKERATGAEVSGALNPAQQVVKIVNEELVGISAARPASCVRQAPPTVVMLAACRAPVRRRWPASSRNSLRTRAYAAAGGLRPAAPGAVTSSDRRRRAGVDVSRRIPAHRRRLRRHRCQATGRRAPAVSPRPGPALRRRHRRHRGPARHRRRADGAGRSIHDAVDPDEVLFVVDAMIGQDAVTTAEAFREGVGFTGVVLTKLDGDARGGAALSVREVVGVPILFASSRRETRRLRRLPPRPMAGRILGMGDVLTLIEQAEQASTRSRPRRPPPRSAATDARGLPRADDGHPRDGADRQPAGHAARRRQMKDALAAVDDSQLDRCRRSSAV